MLYDEQNRPIVLKADELEEYLKDGSIDVTEEEIQDRAKGDSLAKAFVLLQTTWFVVQCIGRAAQHLPVTELEIVALAFITINLAIYVLWWKKPLNVERAYPVRRTKKSLPPTQPQQKRPLLKAIAWPLLVFVRISGAESDENKIVNGANRVPTFYKGPYPSEDYAFRALDGEVILTFVMISLTATFGAIHCIAWSFQFLSKAERISWRACSVVITTYPVLLFPGAILGSMTPEPWDFLIAIFLVVISISYVLARAVLLILPLLALRSLPPMAYQTIEWSLFIPHI